MKIKVVKNFAILEAKGLDWAQKMVSTNASPNWMPLPSY
jgi:hypothetical protein